MMPASSPSDVTTRCRMRCLRIRDQAADADSSESIVTTPVRMISWSRMVLLLHDGKAGSVVLRARLMELDQRVVRIVVRPRAGRAVARIAAFCALVEPRNAEVRIFSYFHACRRAPSEDGGLSRTSAFLRPED